MSGVRYTSITQN